MSPLTYIYICEEEMHNIPREINHFHNGEIWERLLIILIIFIILY
jgi:hypothetical protein